MPPSARTSVDPLPALPCACANLRRAARAVTQLYDAALSGVGINPAQFALLQFLDTAGPTTQGRLGDRLAIDSTTLSRTLRPLAVRGWLVGAPGRDRRERHWRITGAGRRQLARALPRWKRVQSRLQRRVGARSWHDGERLLRRLAEAAVEV